MKQVPIIAPSRIELAAFLEANPWLNAGAVIEVREAKDLEGHTGLVMALPGWNHSPSISDPRGMLEAINRMPVQLVVLEYSGYKISNDIASNRVEYPIDWVGGDPLAAI